ncbi:hypothetical protein [Calditerrivibrio nitroreducens]|uniref:hypothetical protein n=1 Tax=Calditerrivibrio nitroreducens TaxID=477976 RepID=UPI003C744722
MPKECLDVNDDSKVAVCGYLLGMTGSYAIEGFAYVYIPQEEEIDNILIWRFYSCIRY